VLGGVDGISLRPVSAAGVFLTVVASVPFVEAKITRTLSTMNNVKLFERQD
jgi:hypothetical protein